MKVLANAADMIEILAETGPLSAAALAARMDIPRSSAYRLIDGLLAVSLLESLADGRATLSARWLRLADAAHRGMREWADASHVLDRLVEITGQTAFLSVLVDSAAFCIDWSQGRGIDILATRPGRSLPLNAGASGRVLLAFSSMSDTLLLNTPFQRLTATTLSSVDELRADIALTREQGYVYSDGDAATGIAGLAVPIFDDDGALAATISVAGLAQPFREDRDTFTSALLQETSSLQGHSRGYRSRGPHVPRLSTKSR
jgi:DNA-binding IclR family transcriptional regulator